MFTADAKILLKNVIRHTKTHNRLLEEAEMWKQREEHDKYKGKPSPVQGFPECRGRGSPVRKSPKYNGRHRLVGGIPQLSGAHMDRDLGVTTGDVREGEETSTYWRRQLLKVEESDPDRWGHSGFKELYKEFDSETPHPEDSKNRSVHNAKKKCKKKHKEHKRKGYSQKTKSSHKDKRRHRCKNTGEVSDVEDKEEEEVSHRKRARRRKARSDECVWVEKPVATSSEEHINDKNSVQCSDKCVQDRRCVETGDHHSRDRPLEDASVSTKHNNKYSSSHKSHHKRKKSKHKNRQKRKHDSSSADVYSSSCSDA